MVNAPAWQVRLWSCFRPNQNQDYYYKGVALISGYYGHFEALLKVSAFMFEQTKGVAKSVSHQRNQVFSLTEAAESRR